MTTSAFVAPTTTQPAAGDPAAGTPGRSWPGSGSLPAAAVAGAGPTDVRVGIVGTGYTARGLAHLLAASPRMRLSGVLTRRPLDDVAGPWAGRLTHSVDRLVAGSDVVVVTTGDPVHGTDVAADVLRAGLPVVTMDAELQVTAGSYLASLGVVVEAQGDQPGSLALLAHEARQMGLTPLVYGNIKGFLNHQPTPDEMRYWANRQGISLSQVTSFTDGTKLQIEQALVANGLGATIAARGLLGPRADTVPAGALALAEAAAAGGAPIADYVLPKQGSPGVFVVVTFDEELGELLRYYKVRLGDAPYALLERPFHLCSLEVPLTIDRLLRGDAVPFNNGSRPRVGVAAVAKHDLAAGERIDTAIGGFQVRGEAVLIAHEPDHVPIGLLAGATLARPVAAGDTVLLDDVELADSLALRAWRFTCDLALGAPAGLAAAAAR
jgi:predicted homoserine dehydrogenase-like protein